MNELSVRSMISLILVGTLIPALCPAASPSIGIAIAKGSFRLEDSKIWNNATLFDGSTISTDTASSRLRLNNGTQMRLAGESTATVYSTHAVLAKGSAQFEAFSGFTIEANKLRISAAGPNSIARIEVKGDHQLVVSADGGPVLVASAAGIPLANLPPGRTLDFSGQADASSPSHVSGCLAKRNGAYVLTDATANITIELRGNDLEKHVGQRIEVTGTTLAGANSPGVSQVINVSDVSVLAPTCAAPASGITHAEKVAGVAITLAAGLGIGIYVAVDNGKSSNSR